MLEYKKWGGILFSMVDIKKAWITRNRRKRGLTRDEDI